MKKVFAVLFVLIFLASGLFADDALVMPAGVGRFYVAPVYSFATGSFDSEGDFHSFSNDNVQVFNLGFALEFGVTSWITAALQWVPGWTPWSDISSATPVNNTNTNGFADLFAGAKIQLMGPNAPARSQDFRFAIAPGVIIPIPGPNFEEEFNKAMQSGVPTGNAATFSSMDNHVLAFGGRIFFDWVFNRNFFVNLYNETIFYPIRQDLNRDGPGFHGTKVGIAAANAPIAAQIMGISGEVNYKYRLTFEIEPTFSTPIADGITFTVGLPLTYRYTPAPEYSFNLDEIPAPAQDAIRNALLSNLGAEPSHLLSVTPNLGLFIMNTPVPLEFKMMYRYPLWGRSTMAMHNLIFQARVYFAFGR